MKRLQAIRDYVQLLDPRSLGFDVQPDIVDVSELELGEANLNFLVKIDGKKFVFRICMDPASSDKPRKEFETLRMLEDYHISPRAFQFDDSKGLFDEPLLILEYMEGKPLSSGGIKFVPSRSLPKLAGLVARVHSLNLGEGVHLLTRRSTTYEDWIRVNQRNIDYVRRKRSFRRTDGDPLESALSRGLSAVNSIAKQAKYGNVETPAHGDVCAQNVIMDEKTNGIHLIDWENFGLWDPAAEIALIFEGFGLEFRLRQQDEFLKYYGRKRKDDTLRERLDIFRPLVRFEQLTWGIKHVLEIRRGDMDKAFIERTNIKKHLDFVTSCLGKCSESHLIDISRKEATEIRSILVE